MNNQEVLNKVAGGSFIVDQIDYRNVFTPEDFTDEHRMIASTVSEFIEREITVLGEAGNELDYELILKLLKKAGDVGLLGACLPEEYGGLGLDGIRFALIKENFSAGGTSIVMSINGQIGIGMLPIIFFGTEQQRKKYLPQLQAGTLTTAFALTEPQSGTDASGIKTSAKLSEDGKHYILNGSKVFITNAGFADIFVVFAKIDGADFTAFIVEKGLEGLSIGPEEKKMGLKASSTCSMTFEDVKVPVENMLGKPGKGHLFAFNTLNFGRLSVGAGCLGNTKDALGLSVKYANQRVQFGRPISAFPLIGKKIADMNIKAYVLESMVYRTADLFDTGLKKLDFSDPNVGENSGAAISEYKLECGINKVFGSEVLDFAADEGVQIHGGYGYMQEYEIESIYRDSRIKRIFEGTNEINRMFLTKTLIKRLGKGQFPELQEALDQISMDAALPSFEGALAQETYLLEAARKIFCFTFAAALKKYGAKLEHEQEASSDLADILINIYAMESVLLRTKKMIDRNGEAAAQNAKEMTIAFIHEAMDQIAGFAREVFITIQTDEELVNQLAQLDQLSRRVPANTIELKRKIAERVIKAEKYIV
ncbi:acyl-CoA dehydrogenase family protein [Ammoniphilus sp. 3BR4]|uniref:acyl-CoA dehydrogenase family protein n=1 Tax=Ammoniphilus sp. 3BR4 TaxID=3158265 RepID=UPI00346604CC